jgi:hypothetical protein
MLPFRRLGHWNSGTAITLGTVSVLTSLLHSERGVVMAGTPSHSGCIGFAFF